MRARVQHAHSTVWQCKMEGSHSMCVHGSTQQPLTRHNRQPTARITFDPNTFAMQHRKQNHTPGQVLCVSSHGIKQSE